MSDYIGYAKDIAERKHKDQMYGEFDYIYHIRQVVSVTNIILNKDLDLFINDKIIAAAWLHDVVEDTGTTLAYIENALDGQISDIVDLVTDGEGDNRKERKANLYNKFRAETDSHTKLGASIVKLADRYSNQFNSILTKNTSKMQMYTREMDEFMEVYCSDQFYIHAGVRFIDVELKKQRERMGLYI